jgi:hypothetical protein
MLKRTPPSAPPPSAPEPASATHDDDIIERALELIKPKPERIEEARKQVAFAIARVKWASDEPPRQARAAYNREIHEFIAALKAAIAALEQPPIDARLLMYDGRLPKKLAAVVKEAQHGLINRGQQRSLKNSTAAWYAYDLLCIHGIKPKLYKDGAFFQLAALLNEGATGIANANLERACRAILRMRRALSC